MCYGIGCARVPFTQHRAAAAGCRSLPCASATHHRPSFSQHVEVKDVILKEHVAGGYAFVNTMSIDGALVARNALDMQLWDEIRHDEERLSPRALLQRAEQRSQRCVEDQRSDGASGREEDSS